MEEIKAYKVGKKIFENKKEAKRYEQEQQFFHVLWNCKISLKDLLICMENHPKEFKQMLENL